MIPVKSKSHQNPGMQALTMPTKSLRLKRAMRTIIILITRSKSWKSMTISKMIEQASKKKAATLDWKDRSRNSRIHSRIQEFHEALEQLYKKSPNPSVLSDLEMATNIPSNCLNPCSWHALIVGKFVKRYLVTFLQIKVFCAVRNTTVLR